MTHKHYRIKYSNGGTGFVTFQTPSDFIAWFDGPHFEPRPVTSEYVGTYNFETRELVPTAAEIERQRHKM